MATQDNYFQITGVEYDGGPCQTAGDFDPSTSLLDLPAGSLFQRTNGEVWKKFGPLPNEWSKLEAGNGGGVTDHSQLTGRSLPDQHPISAITGLEDNLSGKQEYHGFTNQTDATMTYDSFTKTLTIYQPGGVKYWFLGEEITAAETITVTHPDVASSYFIFFNDTSGVPVVQTTPWNLEVNVLICFIYYNGIVGVAWEERHAAQRDPKYHSYLHNTRGAVKARGCMITNYTLEDPADVSLKYVLSDGLIYDEDIRVAVQQYPLTTDNYLVWHRLPSLEWTYDESSFMPFCVDNTTGYICYDNNGVLTPLTSGQSVNYWVFGTTALLPGQRMLVIMGQTAYDSFGDALYEGFSDMDYSKYPVQESVPLYRITYTAESNYASTGKVVMATVVPVTREYEPVRLKLDYFDLAYKPTPDNPAPASTRFFTSDVANRFFPTFKGPVGVDTLLQPMLGRNKVGLWSPPGNSTTDPGIFGLPTSNRLGGVIARTVTTNSYLERMRRLGFRSNTSTNSFAGVYWDERQYTTGSSTGLGGFFWMLRFGIYDETNIPNARMFVGVTATNTSPLNVEPDSLINCIGLAQLSTNPNNFYVVSGGSVPNLPVMIDNVNFPIDTTTGYEFAIFAPQGTDHTFYWRLTNLESRQAVDGLISGDSTAVPSSNILLTTAAWRCNNTTSGRVGLDIGTLYIETEE